LKPSISIRILCNALRAAFVQWPFSLISGVLRRPEISDHVRRRNINHNPISTASCNTFQESHTGPPHRTIKKSGEPPISI
jgi:hypothetical protein